MFYLKNYTGMRIENVLAAECVFLSLFFLFSKYACSIYIPTFQEFLLPTYLSRCPNNEIKEKKFYL